MPAEPPEDTSGSLLGLERTSLDDNPSAAASPGMLDIEPTAFEEKPPPPPPAAPKPPSIIEQEASQSLLSEDDLLEEEKGPAEPTSHQFEEIAPNDTQSFDANLGDSLGFTISHDSSNLHVDLPPRGEGSEGGLWQQQPE